MWRTLSILLLAVLLAGCAAASGRMHGQTSFPLDAYRLLPLLPVGQSPHSAAAAHATTIPGADAADQSAGALVDGTQLVLPAGPGALEWALYELPTNGYPVLGVEASLDLADGTAYAGISDYVRGTWVFQQADAEYSLLADADNASPGGFVYLVLATYDASTVRVIDVSIVLDQPGWVVHPVVANGRTLSYLRLFADGPGGLPHIAYIDLGSRQVRLARSNVELPTQSADWADVLVDTSFTDVFSVALDAQFISGKPALAYGDSTTDELLYTYARNAAPVGIDDWSTCVVDAYDALLPQISLCELAMMPRLAYDSIPGELQLAASDTATPADSDWNLSLIANDAHRPALLDLGLELGLCYLQLPAGGNTVYYAYSTTGSPEGPADWEFSELYPTLVENMPGATALVKVRPAADWLPFCAATVSIGYELHGFQSAAEHPVLADWTEMTLGQDEAVTNVAACAASGRPAVAYMDDNSSSVLVVWATVAQPAQMDDWQFSTLGTNGGNRSVSIAEVASTIAVAYFDADSLELRFAYMAP